MLPMTLPFHHPSIYLITDRQAFHHRVEHPSQTLLHLQLEAIQAAAQAGCPFIQIREKDLSAAGLLNFTRMAINCARPYGAKVIVNDRLDVAFAAGADGVHLRVNSLSASEARRQAEALGLNQFLIAVSTHSLAQAQAAEAAGADFIVGGPVYDTPSKRAYGPPLGIERFAAICAAVHLPVFALGGITLENFREPLQAGATGIAAIGLFCELEGLSERIQQILDSRKS